MCLASVKDWSEIAKNVFTSFGFLAGGIFFAYRFCAGYFLPNIVLEVATDRRHSTDSSKDIVAISTTIIKGDRGRILIHDAQVRITAASTRSVVPLVGTERLTYRKEKSEPYSRRVLWDQRAESAPFLSVTPGEKTTFSCYAEIASNEPCTIEVVIVGKRPYSRMTGQWRASHVSLPTV